VKVLSCFFLIPLLIFSQKKEMPFKTYSFSASEGLGLCLPSGSFIFVSANTFQFPNGSSCKENILLKFREFHSQSDMYFAGLNMLLAAEDGYAMVESIGMFEIQAWCGDKELVIREGKTIQVRMKTRRNSEDNLAFKYDPQKNEWSVNGAIVYDFSFQEEHNKCDSIKYWGAVRVGAPALLASKGKSGGGIFEPEKKVGKIPSGFYKCVNITHTGIYNIGNVIKNIVDVKTTPVFVSAGDSLPLLPTKIYIAYEGYNSLAYYYPDQMNNKFRVYNSKGIKMFLELKNGTMAATVAGEMDNLSFDAYRNKKIKIMMHHKKPAPKNEKEFADATGLIVN
jgi:hypothetical protein